MSLGAIGSNRAAYEPNPKSELPVAKRTESEERVESVRQKAITSEKTPARDERQKEYKRESSYDRDRSYRSSHRRVSLRDDDRKSRSRRDDERPRYDKKRGRSPYEDDRKYERREESSRHYSSYKTPRTKEPEPVKHTLPMSGVVYLENIKNGIKTHEGRICRGTVQSMKVNDLLVLRDKRANRGIECQITSYTRYNSFKEMLVAQGVLNMLPQLTDFAKTATPDALLDKGIRVYQGFPGSQEVTRLGVVAIGVKFIKDC